LIAGFLRGRPDRTRATPTFLQWALYVISHPFPRAEPLSKASQSFVASIAAQYGRRLHRFLSARLRNSAEVPDLAQEVFLRLLRVTDHEGIRSPEAYLFTIASHVIHQHSLRKSAEPVPMDIADVFPELQALAGDDPVAQVDQTERIAQFELLLSDLPPRVATALVMHKIGGYSVQEIGDHLGVARETAKDYLARAAAHCRNHRSRLG
jgi:RNA polymerase sigma-70 factor (ECF subfamily)